MRSSKVLSLWINLMSHDEVEVTYILFLGVSEYLSSPQIVGYNFTSFQFPEVSEEL